MSIITEAVRREEAQRKDKHYAMHERHRQERVAVGRICKCGACVCCEEYRLDKARNKR